MDVGLRDSKAYGIGDLLGVTDDFDSIFSLEPGFCGFQELSERNCLTAGGGIKELAFYLGFFAIGKMEKCIEISAT